MFSTFGIAARPSCPALNPKAEIEYSSGKLLDAFAPAGRPRHAAIVVHGRSGDRRTHVNQVLEVLEKAGWAWFSVDYSSVSDVELAVRFVQCAGRFNILPVPVLIGEDTGAALVLNIATRGNLLSAVVFGVDMHEQIQDPKVPVLMFHGEEDDDFAFSAAKAACENWQQCTFVPIPGGSHNLENWHPDQWFWKEDLEAWLRLDQRGAWNDLVYSRAGGQALLMDAFVPAGAGPFQSVVVVHGGGWEAGDRKTYVSPILDILARSGLAYFSIDYRLTPYVGNDVQVDDVRTAIRYIRAHASRFHVNSNRIVLLGESAGGQIVSQLASLPCAGCAVSALVSLYGVYDFTQFTKDAGGKQMLHRIFGDRTSDLPLMAASPISHVSKSMPPMLLLQGTDDELYPGTLAYDAALKREGVPHELIILKGAPHGMENWVTHPEWVRALENIPVWLRNR